MKTKKVICMMLTTICLLILISCSTEPENEAPVISSLTANPYSVEVGGTSTLTCIANDPDGDNLDYIWQPSAGSITGDGAIVTWTAPEDEGIYSVSCTVDDGNGGQDVESINIEVTGNQPPVISSLTADPDIVEIEGTSTLTCIANDPDGDNLTYTWESASGTIDGTGHIVTWTAPSTEGTYSVSCKVEDGNGGQDIEIINITVFDLTKDLVAYYPFNGNANDESGNGNDGTVNGSTLSTDRFGNENRAYSFDGMDDYILVPDTDYLDITTDGTILGWVNIPSTFSPPSIGVGFITKMLHSTGMYSYDIMIGHGDPLFACGISDGSNGLYVYSYLTDPDSLYDDFWHLLTFTWDNEELKLYLDDNPANYITNTTNGAQISNWDLHIGRRAYASSTNWKYFKGYIDDIRIYKRVLTEDEIQALYNEGGWPRK